ncbi:MAG: DNA repair protein RecN [Nitrospirae bacterium CG2_30_53_67]|nr:MAG: DNA repair protein RecN [Nitrospirae bacterium CG2_30_53_67]
MLRDLRIQNFAIIEDISLTFDLGLNIITGDTGAGKSILVGALGLILGGRGSPEMIRTGEEQARITACFDLRGQPEQIQRIRDLGIEIPDGELMVHRNLSRSGKAKITLNGDPATAGILSQISENLVDIHGQHEHHSLLNREHHIDLLDAFGGLSPILSQYKEVYLELTRLKEKLHRLEREGKDLPRRIDFLQYQIREIMDFNPEPGEEEDLIREIQVLRNTERIASLAQGAYAELYESEGAVSDRIGRIIGSLSELSSIDMRIEALSKQGEEVKYRIEDMARTLRDYLSRIEPDPDRLAAVEERLEGLRHLKRKYGPTIEEILQFRQAAEEDLKGLTGDEADHSLLNEACNKALTAAAKLAEDLSKSRRSSARSMERALEKELAVLGMSGTRFVAQMEKYPARPEDPADTRGRALTSKGMDQVEFLVSPNVGEEPKALSRIASGGELSRIMLAIKTVLAGVDRVGILVFDEVDSGIGGGIAEVLGKRLAFVARDRQVICVTHLPQIASQGNTHYHIAKEVQDGRTRVTARRLESKDRIQEIARMLGGIEMTRTTVQHAKEMLKLSNGL